MYGGSSPFAEQIGGGRADERHTRAGAKLVAMALAVDLVFAGELAQRCGAAVWNEVRAAVGERFRAVYAIRNGKYQQYALAAMLATGADDFREEPLGVSNRARPTVGPQVIAFHGAVAA